MFRAKLDQALHELCFAARFLGNFQAAQSAASCTSRSRTLPARLRIRSSIFRSFFWLRSRSGTSFFEQSLQPPRGRAEAVDALGLIGRTKLQQVASVFRKIDWPRSG